MPNRRHRLRSDLMTGPEVAAYLRIGIATWYRGVYLDIPHVFVGRRRKYRLADVEAWMAQRTQRAGESRGAA